MTKETKEEEVPKNKKDPLPRTKATIEIEGNQDEIILTVTFDPAPELDKKQPIPITASIASALVNTFNAKCVFLEGTVAIDKLRIPQLDVEYDREKIHISALNEINNVVKDFVIDSLDINLKPDDKEEVPDAKTVSAKRTLH